MNEALGLAAIHNMKLGTAKQLSWLKKKSEPSHTGIPDFRMLEMQNSPPSFIPALQIPRQVSSRKLQRTGNQRDAKDIGNCDSYDLQFLNMELRNTLDKFCVTIIKISIPSLQ